VAGSNGHIAWGFTNSYGEWFSLRHVACSHLDEDRIRTPEGELTRDPHQRAHRRARDAEESFEILMVGDAVLLEADPVHASCWLGAWLAQKPDATNLRLMGLERARTVDEALAIAPEIGIPHQNLLVGDSDGHIGWSIAGRIPRDTGATRAQGDVRWVSAAEHPRLVDPPIGRLWTANARVVADPAAESLLGGHAAALGAEYDLGARAQQIRDALLPSIGRPRCRHAAHSAR